MVSPRVRRKLGGRLEKLDTLVCDLRHIEKEPSLLEAMEEARFWRLTL